MSVLAAWLFGFATCVIVFIGTLVLYQLVEAVSLRATKGQDHMTRNPGKGS